MNKENKTDGSSAEAENDEIVVTDSDDANDQEVQDPIEQISDLEKKLAITHERLMRTAAEMDNVRKRSRRDVEEAGIRGRIEVLREILPVIDSIDLALSSADPKGAAAGIIEGIEMVRKQFLNATERFELKPIETLDCNFDPNFHEAVAQIESSEHATGQVVEEMRKGYMLGARLLRAAMVIVSKGSPESSEPEEKTASDELNANENENNKNSEVETAKQEEENASFKSEVQATEDTDNNEKELNTHEEDNG